MGVVAAAGTEGLGVRCRLFPTRDAALPPVACETPPFFSVFCGRSGGRERTGESVMAAGA